METKELEATPWPGMVQIDQPASERVIEVRGTPVAILPEGYSAQKLCELMEAPTRVSRTLRTLSLDSLAEYVNRHENGNSVVLVDCDRTRVEAILDYHPPVDSVDGEQLADWCEHRATYEFPLTPEWTAWSRANGNWLSQVDFAEFLEDRSLEIREPDSATMLEIAHTLQAKREVNFKSGIRTESGDVDLRYEQSTTASAGGSGKFEIPSLIKLTLRPFRGGAPYEVHARFRYRIVEGVLKLSYQLVRPERVIEDAFNGDIQELRGKLNEDVTVLEASA